LAFSPREHKGYRTRRQNKVPCKIAPKAGPMQGTSVDGKGPQGQEDDIYKGRITILARGQGQIITRGQEQIMTLKQRTEERENKESKSDYKRTRGQVTSEESQVWGL
jgi:hypothetical protein